jgi:hypothetical protein
MRTHKKGVDQIYHASKPNNGASRSCEETTHIKVIRLSLDQFYASMPNNGAPPRRCKETSMRSRRRNNGT